jgi:ABC-type Na+ efflux pump permease subunit
MRITRRALLAGIAGLAVAAALAGSGAGGTRQAQSTVQPPAWVPITATAPGLPAVVGPAQLWAQPPAWIPIAD